MSSGFRLPQGSTIGILGGGQLGRMLALAAGKLGMKCHIFAPEVDSPAFQVCAEHSVAEYTNKKALKEFAAHVDVVTFEFENVPVGAVQYLETLKIVRPGSKALAVAQDRLQEKSLARSLGAKTAEYRTVNSRDDLNAAVADIGVPAVLKTVRLGYDGKGQAKLLSVADIPDSWLAMKNAPAILESFVKFNCEVSVVAARSGDGTFAAYDVVLNVHRNHILHTSAVPAGIDPLLEANALEVTRQIMDRLEYVGVMAVEFFVGRGALYVNEIAPRVHNSGHWTQDACAVSQFEQHIRAVAGWPLGATKRHSDVVMTNLLGGEIFDCEDLAIESQTGVHIYGKTEARAGRKMGHFNKLFVKE